MCPGVIIVIGVGVAIGLFFIGIAIVDWWKDFVTDKERMKLIDADIERLEKRFGVDKPKTDTKPKTEFEKTLDSFKKED